MRLNSFIHRHIGPGSNDQDQMLDSLGFDQIDNFVKSVVPGDILLKSNSQDFVLDAASEFEATQELRAISSKNKNFRSLIGLGYCGTEMPAVVKRHVFENPSWYTAYTPYQAEISQGRLEALFNFQTLVSELTGLPIANASLLDEATAAAEAMSLSFNVCTKKNANKFLVDPNVYPQTLAVLKTRSVPLGISVQLLDPNELNLDDETFGIFLQIPGCNGRIWDPSDCIRIAHKFSALVTTSIDPLAQVLITPVAKLGVDIAIGSMQRFGVPYGFGGPHAAFFAIREEFKRQIPGRIVGRSIDKEGNMSLRLALQTREQHIRRDRATSNICTAQVLLAVIASFYAVFHGSKGLEEIAIRVSNLLKKLEINLKKLGFNIEQYDRFDSIDVYSDAAPKIIQLAQSAGFNLRILPLGVKISDAKGFGITVDELTNQQEINMLSDIFAQGLGKDIIVVNPTEKINENVVFNEIPLRIDPWLQQVVFTKYRSETELMRYIYHLSNKDFSLVNGMIPLGSCTMKLNAVSELGPISWREFADIHPFVPEEQTEGYRVLFRDLEDWLCSLTGFSVVSLQPNAGSQGEFAGLLVIRAWHHARGDSDRDICLIPTSAHGTNPASSVMAGMKVVPIACDAEGNVDLQDLEQKAIKYSQRLAALMITYPSTHGVFELEIKKITKLVHKYGAQVYLDGANFNAQVGLCRPIDYGIDICHLNLHKTFCIPHGGGGPGVGPIAAAEHLEPYMPGHPLSKCGGNKAIGAIASAPYGSAGILPISWMYLRMMGTQGLRKSSEVALLSANYIAKKLQPYYPVLFKGFNGLVAHECILDLRPLKKIAGIEVEDIAKRLMDYGFHAPTISWPVAGTMMVEPTESESLDELNRFCNAMIAIRYEVEAIEKGKSDRTNNALKHSPHTLKAVTNDIWDKPYSRTEAAFPLGEDQLINKFWPSVARINNAIGDRNLICTCPSMEDIDHQ